MSKIRGLRKELLFILISVQYPEISVSFQYLYIIILL